MVNISKDRGFGLIDSLIAVGLLSLVAVTSMSIFNNNLLQQKFIEQKYSSTNLHKEIYDYLSNFQACTATFSDATQTLLRSNIDGAGEEFSFTSIKSPDGTTDIYKKYSAPGDPTYDNDLLRIESLKLKGFTDNGLDALNRYSATVVLEIKYKQNSRTIGPEIFRPKLMKINFVFRRTDTTPPAGPDISNDQEVFSCKAVGGIGDSFWSLTSTGDGIFYSEKVGIGKNNPHTNLHVSGIIGASNETAGASLFNIIQLFVESPDIGVVNYGHYSGSPSGRLDLRTENVPRLSILQSNGNVGVGTVSPSTRLEVAGEVKLASTNTACSGSNEGSIRYNSTFKIMEFCDGSGSWKAIGSTRIYSGTAGVTWNNGATESNLSASIAIPGGCSSPKVFVRPKSGSIACFPSPCAADPVSASQDIHAYATNPGVSFQVFLSGSSGASIPGPISPTYEIDWLIVCN